MLGHTMDSYDASGVLYTGRELSPKHYHGKETR